MKVLIRSERLNDHEGVRAVIAQAFAVSEFGHNGEADLVERLRSECDELVSLVAQSDSDVVGHVLFSPVELEFSEHSIRGMSLAPMAVHPKFQNAGIGTQLVKQGLKELRDAGIPFIVVLGHPEYYPRFGFQPAIDWGITHPFEGIPQDVFFVRIFDESRLSSNRQGVVRYPAAFSDP